MSGAIENGSRNLIDAFWRDDRATLNLGPERLGTPSQRRFQAIFHIIRE